LYLYIGKKAFSYLEYWVEERDDMKVCVVSYSFYELDYRVRRYAEALVSIGHRVDAVALRSKGEKELGVLNGVKIYRIQKRKLNEKGPWSYLLERMLFFTKAGAILLFGHLKFRYKVIHINNPPDFLVFVALIPKLLGARIILDMHENLPEFYGTKFNKGSDALAVRVLLFLEKISTNFADRVIAAHNLLRERIIKRDGILPENCTALLNYPNLRFFGSPSPRLNGNHFRIVYPGTVSHRHGLDIAIKALAIVKKELPGVRFDIYTKPRNDEYYKFLIRLVDDLNLGDNVKIRQPVMPEELGKMLPNASLGIVPKRGDAFGSEAFSTKILDFMAAGVPVISSRTRIEEYYFNDSMIMFFEPENHHDLARCILELYNNPGERQSLVDNAKRFIAKNNWEVKKEIYYRIINQLVQ
jgi:glycosyltransferase involved in cell wall biosynthesis